MPSQRLKDQPKCGAVTKQGTPCQAVAVKGVGRCRIHGGGKALLARYEAELRTAKHPKRVEWLLRQLARASRNKETRYVDSPSTLVDSAKRSELAAGRLAHALREGSTDREAVARWTRAVEAVRPYRMEIATPLVAEALAGVYGTAVDGAAVLADALALDEGERRTFFRAAGVPDRARAI